MQRSTNAVWQMLEELDAHLEEAENCRDDLRLRSNLVRRSEALTS